MKINGLQKLTLLDFPGKTACTVFCGGCNFRCPFCHNASLVTGDNEAITHEEFFSFLSRRKGLLDGVAVTGGEPLLHPDLADFLARIKEMGYSVKLDTNGSFPEHLKRLCAAGLVDYVAMDIKSSFDGYSHAAGCTVDTAKIQESVNFLLSGSVDYEFRTTAARGYVAPEDFPKIAEMLRGARRYFIQGFRDSGALLGEGAGAYSDDEMKALLHSVLTLLPNAELRGI